MILRRFMKHITDQNWFASEGEQLRESLCLYLMNIRDGKRTLSSCGRP